ncbi:MAG: PD40 domain-containing protein [Planctomycetes bacterium]|nr:PD40 domain-containing protein [Planctomycetota bacterium]MBL7146460.1 PD40 domain-containing protein [Phycisphaerae bacterium]
MSWNKKTIWNLTMALTALKEDILANTTICLLTVVALVLGGQGAYADFTFGTPTNLGPSVNSSLRDSGPCISSDGLSLYFDSKRGGGSGADDIWVTTRETVQDPWGEPVNLGPTVNSSSWDFGPMITANGLELYFGSTRPGGYGAIDGWVTTRASVSEPWGEPVNLGSTVNSSAEDAGIVSADGLSFIISSNRSGGYGGQDLWISTRPSLSDEWSEPVNLGPTVNSSAWDWDAELSADGLWLLFTSQRPGGLGGGELWLTTRETTNDPWSTPMNLGAPVNSSSDDAFAGISVDGSTLYFTSNRPGGQGSYDTWQAPIIPIVDLNNDGIVDATDMCIIVDKWGTDDPLCDIGPMPWGDGIVDVQDLIVLAEHLFEEVPPVE